MNVERVSISNRLVRSEFIARRFGPYLRGKVLDVGCDKAHLRRLVGGLDYTGIDVGGEPDLVINLEKVDRLPFQDNTFDCVVCSDVLEHVDNLHWNFDELIRVAKGHAIISLPNNWANARRPIGRGHGSIGHYGLPPAPPADRHKWFFSLEEGRLFAEAQVRRLPISIVELFAIEKPRFPAVSVLRRLRYPSQISYLNRYAHSLWVVLKKRVKCP